MPSDAVQRAEIDRRIERLEAEWGDARRVERRETIGRADFEGWREFAENVFEDFRTRVDRWIADDR